MSNAEKLLNDLKKHPDAEAHLKECGRKETMPEYAEALLSVAKKLGIETDIKAAELTAYLEKMEASKKNATEQAASYIVAVEDENVANVVGGKTICGSRQMNEDHVLDCFIDDLCAWVYN